MSMKIEGLSNAAGNDVNNISGTNNKTNETTDKKGQEKGNNIYAGNLHLPGDEIAEKKAKAGRDAVKTLIEQFESDIMQDELVAQLKEARDKLQEDVPQYNENIKNLNNSLERLDENFNIEEDSEEKAELELRRKAQKGEKLTGEEMKKLSEMGEPSEYQKAALEYYNQIDYFSGRIESVKVAVEQCNKSLTDISINRLKDNGMVDAVKEAEKILANANREIMQMAIDEAVDTIDEKQEEAEDKADKVKEEKAEEKKKEQEKLEEKIERDIENSERRKNAPLGPNLYVAEIFDDDEIYQAIMEEVKAIADMNALSDEDIKGLLADLKL